MNIHEILDRLPHRYPFIFIDKVIHIEPNKRIIATKNVSINEPYFQGHFPGRPVMPGVLILEALAQASMILSNYVEGAWQTNSIYYFAGIDEARFKRVVEPGDVLRLEIDFLKQKRDMYMTFGQAFVEDKLACSAHLMSVKKEIK